MSQSAYWASGAGPHRCPLHESVAWVPGEGVPAQPQSQELRAEARGVLTRISVPPPCGHVGNCIGLPVPGCGWARGS